MIAAAISYVSIQMQSIIARSNGAGISIEQATAQLGINPIALVWERSALVLVLIFMSGWFRSDQRANAAISSAQETTNEAIEQLAQQVQHLAGVVTQITTTVTEVKTTVTQFALQGGYEQPVLTERTGANEQDAIIDAELIAANAQGEQDTNLGDQIRTLLVRNPQATDRELAKASGCSSSTANKWKRRVLQEQAVEQRGKDL